MEEKEEEELMENIDEEAWLLVYSIKWKYLRKKSNNSCRPIFFCVLVISVSAFISILFLVWFLCGRYLLIEIASSTASVTSLYSRGLCC
jgi:hypothetical protein